MIAAAWWVQALVYVTVAGVAWLVTSWLLVRRERRRRRPTRDDLYRDHRLYWDPATGQARCAADGQLWPCDTYRNLSGGTPA